jgi:outer membrane protein assembly factor BamB
MHRRALAWLTIAVAGSAALAAGPKPEETWPGFRGHGMSGIAPSRGTPDRWSKTENVRWKVAIPGQGWSSPIVWGDTVFITSGISKKPFKQPSPGLYGNDYIAELQKQGLSDDEVLRRVRARDNETPDESDEIRYVVYALDAKSGKVKWEREAIAMKPSGGRHRKNTYASETPFTDGERLYVSFGQNVGLFCYTLDGKLLWKKQWEPQAIYLDFGTASSPTVHNGRIYLLHDSELDSYITALDAKNGNELWRTARPRIGLPKSSWTTPFVWEHPLRTEIVTTGHGMILAYGTDGRELWRVTGMSMPTASPSASNGILYVGSGSQADGANRPFLAIKPGASGDITLAKDATSNDFILWRHPRASGYTPSALVHEGRAYLVHDTGILAVLDVKTGKEIYKARIGGGGHTFSASPVAAGNRVFLLDELGATFVLEMADEYREIAKNDLDEMSLASPAIAAGSIYIRTESSLYRIGG